MSVQTSKLFESFQALRNRDLRTYIGGQLVSLIGTWMQATAQAWVVWQLSHSTVALGIVAMLASVSFLLLGPFAGALADRVDRRKLLMISQAMAMTLAFGLAYLVQAELVRLWHVYAFALLLGLVSAVDMPAQQAFIGDLAGRENVRNAVSINSAVFQLSRMVGPAIAGWVIGVAGVATAFWINGLSFCAVIASLYFIRAQQERTPKTSGSLAQFREALAFIRARPRVQDLLVVTILVTVFGISVMQIMPSFATDVLHGDARVLGLLMGLSGAGAVIGSLILAPMAQRARRTGIVLALAVVWTGAWLVIFARSTWLPLSLASMFSTGIGIPVAITSTNGLLQMLAPRDMRARLISTMLMVSFGVQPFAALAIGAAAHVIGSPNAVTVYGVLMAAGGVALLALRPGLRVWDAAADVRDASPDRGGQTSSPVAA